MFIWKTERILDEIARQMPQLSHGLERIRSSIGKDDYFEVFSEVWNGLAVETIDYGVMEKASDVRVIPASDMEWFDIGGWDRFFDLMEADNDGNLVLCKECFHFDTKRSLIFQQSDGSRDRLIAVLGMEDIILVESDDVTLICPRHRAEEIRHLVKTLSEMGKHQFL
jgi:mannose-1-phosphate guanylyltransferase